MRSATKYLRMSDDIRKYSAANRISHQLKRKKHFTINKKDQSTNLTNENIQTAEKLTGVESFYTAGNIK